MRLRTAGFTKQIVFEILAAISHKVLSNYTNHIVDTPIDDGFKPFAWTGPVQRTAVREPAVGS